MNDLARMLTPCTKCGARAEIVDSDGWYHVKCTKCNAAAHHEVPSVYEAIVNWNATTAHIKASDEIKKRGAK